MTELLSRVEAPSDAELISRVRGGDTSAYGELFSRHVDAARRLGRQLVRGTDADDLVSDAFAKTLQVLQGGGGPDVAFRAYLLTSLRRLHVDRIRAAKRVQPSDDMTVYDDGVPFQDTAVANFENGAAAKAFSSLPERWQLVLWHLEVEGQKPADIAPLLGMSANSVSALAYRAREGLRQAFLTMHLADSPTEQCRWVNEHLGAYVRKGLSRRDTAKVEEHLDGCRRCTAMYLELNEVNSNLAGIIAPLILGAAAAGYISSVGAGLTGVSAVIGRVRDAFSTQVGGGGTSAGTAGGAGGVGGAGSGAAAAGSAISTGAIAGGAVTTGGMITGAGVIAAGVAAVTTAAFVFGGGSSKEVIQQADKPAGVVQAPRGAVGPGGATQQKAQEKGGTSQSGPNAAAAPGASSSGASWIVGESGRPNMFDSGTVDVSGGPERGWGRHDVPADTPGSGGHNSAPGANPGSGPGSDPGSGNSNPGTDPGSGPGSDPGTGNGNPGTDPGSDPGNTDPGNTDPGNTDPGNTDPGNTDPGTDPGSGPGDGQGDPAVSARLTITGGDTVVDGQVAFSLQGEPALPATVTVSITSQPGGITFRQDGPCTTVDDTTVTCSTKEQALNSLVTAIPMIGDGVVRYDAKLPLNIPETQSDTDIVLTVTPSDANVRTDVNKWEHAYRYSAPVAQPPVEEPAFAIVSGTGPIATPIKDDQNGRPRYDLSVRLTGLKAGGSLVLELTKSSDSFEPSEGCTISEAAKDQNSDRGRIMTCTLQPGARERAFNLVAWLPGNDKDSTLVASLDGEKLAAAPVTWSTEAAGATQSSIRDALMAAMAAAARS